MGPLEIKPCVLSGLRLQNQFSQYGLDFMKDQISTKQGIEGHRGKIWRANEKEKSRP